MRYNIYMMIQSYISNPMLLVYLLPALLLSLTLHEWAHAYAAHLCGDDTAKMMGRMTLNPLAHLDIFGTICLLFAGFGWAKPVPVNSRNFRSYRKGTVIVSLAGVTMNFLLLVVSSLIWFLGMKYLHLYNNEAFMYICMFFVSYNSVLMLFNLIPIYPLDGYHVLEILLGKYLPAKFFMWMRKYGNYLLIAVIIGMRFTSVSLFSWLPNLIIDLIYSAL